MGSSTLIMHEVGCNGVIPDRKNARFTFVGVPQIIIATLLLLCGVFYLVEYPDVKIIIGFCASWIAFLASGIMSVIAGSWCGSKKIRFSTMVMSIISSLVAIAYLIMSYLFLADVETANLAAASQKKIKEYAFFIHISISLASTFWIVRRGICNPLQRRKRNPKTTKSSGCIGPSAITSNVTTSFLL